MRITQFPDGFKKVASDLAYRYEAEYHGCSQAVLAALMELLGISDDLLLTSASCLAGGCTRGLTCGALTAGLMILGLKYGRRRLEDGMDALGPCYEAGIELVDRFLEEYGSTGCRDVVGYDFSDPAQVEAFWSIPEAHEKAFRAAANVAGWTAEIISRRGL